MGYTIAVVGATGSVGKEMLSILSEREFPADKVHALASSSSIGREVSFGEEKTLFAENLEGFNFSTVDIALFACGGDVAKKYAPIAAKQGCIVIDNSSHFRMDPDVPLVIPEVNPEALESFRAKNIIANPNCSTIQMLVALKPLHDRAIINRISVSTYQSVSGAGQGPMDELFNQSRGMFANNLEEPKHFTKRISFNVIPHIDTFMEDGATREEWKMAVETQKILDPAIKLHATCVRVPVFIGHSEAINLELDMPLSAEEATELLKDAPGISVVDHRKDGGYVTPIECAGDDLVFVSRIRNDPTTENGLSLWVVSDNLRKGAALNAIQIAETLIKDHLEK